MATLAERYRANSGELHARAVPNQSPRWAAAALRGEARSGSSSLSRSGSLLQVASNLSRWPTRRNSLLPALDPSLALFDFEDVDSGELGAPSSSPSFALEVEDDELAKTVEADSWFTSSRPRGTMLGLRKDHRLPPKSQLPYWGGYGHFAQDWDALMTCDALKYEDLAPPRRVLDLGCGMSAHWCLEMLRKKGWEQTHFVGLDAAPVTIPSSILPYEHSSRLSIIQHNFLEALPFDDGRFDLVRMSSLFSSVPEDRMNDLLDEVHRVLTPGGTLFLVEPQAELILPPPTQPDAAEQFLPIKHAFVKVLEERFVNSRPLSLIPASLAMSFGRTEKGPAEEVELPGWKLVAGERVDEAEKRARVLLHSYAQYVENCAPALVTSTFPTPPFIFHPPHLRQVAEFEALLSSYASSLTSIASLPHLLADSLGWAPTMDIEAARLLTQDIIPGFTDQLEENEQLARDLAAADGYEEGDEWEKEELVQIESVRQQLSFRKREAQAELKEVRSRIGEGIEVGERRSLGSLRVGRWTARKA